MVYIMKFQIDGCCRNNGTHFARGAAGCVLIKRNGRPSLCWGKVLSTFPYRPTNQRAELTALILALKAARSRYQELDISAGLRVIIETDSKYVVGCMSDWIQKWVRNGWVNAAGRGVVNRDLLEEAHELEEDLGYLARGEVRYKWIPRSENEYADRHCNSVLDEHGSDY